MIKRVELKGSRFVPFLLVGVALLIFLAAGIDWSERITNASAPTFSTRGTDFTDFDALAARLAASQATDGARRADAASDFIWHELADSTRAALRSLTTDPPRPARVAMLAADLNRVISSGYSIYRRDRFRPDSDLVKQFKVKLVSVENWNEIDTLATTTVIVASLGDSLRFRVSYFPGEYSDYGEEHLAAKSATLAALKPRLTQQLVAADSAELLGMLTDLLGFTVLSTHIDAEKRDASERLGKHLWLNRLLLENEYPQIEKKLPEATEQLSGWNEAVKTVRDYVGTVARLISDWLSGDIPQLLRFQLSTIWILSLCALLPAIAGLIFRRAFWAWFLGSFAILFAVNWAAYKLDIGAVGYDLAGTLRYEYGNYLWAETLLVLLLLVFRLERHSAALVPPRARRNANVLASLLVLTVAGFAYRMTITGVDLFSLTTATLLSLAAFKMLRQSLRTHYEPTAIGRNIVICVDGTWNEPGTTDFGALSETNVLKLFRTLKGTKPRGHYNARQAKEYLDERQTSRQIAFYYHGVGNKVENSRVGQLLGGAFGIGADAIVERAYLDVVRVYRPGDRIFIFGFSRGAAIARLVAGVIGKRDIPRSLWTLRVFGQHWLVRRSAGTIDESAPAKVEVLGCWDTVGAFGISKNIFGIPLQRMNLVHDLDVSLCVKRAYHMVALDETRDAFVPTLMDPDPTTPDRVIEVWFSGNHANVGGGYSTDGLSDVTLDFLLRHLSSGYAWQSGMTPGSDESWGLYLSAAKKGVAADVGQTTIVDPNPSAQLRHETGAAYSYLPRSLPTSAVIHDSVFDRMLRALPVYAPASLYRLNGELVRMRAEIETETTKLAESGSIDGDELREILDRSKQHLILMKWSAYLDSSLADGVALRERLTPAKELGNSARRRDSVGVGAVRAG